VKYQPIGELLFQTHDKGVAVVCVYRGQSSFRLTRTVQPAVIEEVNKADSGNLDIARYILEATLKWTDLERDGVQWKPQSAPFAGGRDRVGTFWTIFVIKLLARRM
jgi:hypothetical protein